MPVTHHREPSRVTMYRALSATLLLGCLAGPAHSQTAKATDDNIPWMGPAISLKGSHKLDPPTHPLRGYLFRRPFRGESAVFTNGTSLMISGSSGRVLLSLHDKNDPWGQTIRLPKTHVQFWADGWRGMNQPASAVVIFEKPRGGRVRGRLVVTAGSQLHVHVLGAFEAAINPAKDAKVEPFASQTLVAKLASGYALTSLKHGSGMGPQRGILGKDRTVTLPDGKSGDLYWLRPMKDVRHGLVMDGPQGLGVQLYTCDGTPLASPGAPRRAILDPPPRGRFLFALVTGPKDASYTLGVRQAVKLEGLKFSPVEMEKSYDITIPATAHKLGRDLTQGYAFDVPANQRLYVIHKKGPAKDRRPQSYLLTAEGIILDHGFGSGHQYEVKDAGRYLVLHRTRKPCNFSMLVRVRPIRRR